MLPSEARRFQNLLIENAAIEGASAELGSPRASIEFVCGRLIGQDESMCIPIAVSEFSLADLNGHPHLLGRVEHGDGRVEFRYGLSGSLSPHR